MHFQKQTEVKINPGDFAGREAWELWSSLAGQMQAGINRAVGVASGNSSPRFLCTGGAAISLGVWDCRESGAAGGGKAWVLGPANVSPWQPQAVPPTAPRPGSAATPKPW